MEALVISPDFTIEDIHKIREYHYELTGNMASRKEAVSIMKVEENF